MRQPSLAMVRNGRIEYLYGDEANIDGTPERLTDGLYSFDPRFDWQQEDSGLFLFKPEFKRADQDLGYKTYHGGPAFIALARHFAGDNRRLDREVRIGASSCSSAFHPVYALGSEAVSSVMTGIDRGDTTVTGLMSERRLNVVRAVLGDVVIEPPLSDESSAADLRERFFREFGAQGLESSWGALDAGETARYSSIDGTRVGTIDGSVVVKAGREPMRLYRTGEVFEAYPGDNLEWIAGEAGWQYVRGCGDIEMDIDASA